MRERLLIGGDAKSGKTHTALDIISNDLGAKCHYIECDDGVRRLVQLQFPSLQCPVCKGARADSNGVICRGCGASGVDTKRITLTTVHNWPDFKAACSKAVEEVKARKLGASDWIILDGIDIIHASQRFEYVSRVYAGTVDKDTKQQITSTWDAVIARRRTGAPVLEPSDWEPIYSEFESALNPIVFESPCNVLATAGLSELRTEGRYEDKNQTAFYRAMGMPWKFDGYKRMPRVFDTLITTAFDLSGYYFTVWGDRGSRGMAGHPVGQRIKLVQGFFFDYLVKMAGYGG